MNELRLVVGYKDKNYGVLVNRLVDAAETKTISQSIGCFGATDTTVPGCIMVSPALVNDEESFNEKCRFRPQARDYLGQCPVCLLKGTQRKTS
jgi:hypothetical protein